MSKYILLLALLLAGGVSGAQGLYIKVSGGYALPISSQAMTQDGTLILNDNGEGSLVNKRNKGSYGAGTTLNSSVGYKFSPFIGADLSFSYLIGKEFSGKTTFETPFINGYTSEKTQAKGFLLAPSILFMAGTGKVRPYATLGLALGKFEILTQNDTLLSVDVGDVAQTLQSHLETKFTGDLTFGFRAGIGIDYNITNRIGVFAEGVINTMNYYPKESEITVYTASGRNVLPELTTSERKVVFKESITLTSTGGEVEMDNTKPREELQESLPVNNFTFSFGVKVLFGWD